MRIGIVCYPTFGGSGVLATELGKALANEGHAVHFITYRQPVRLNEFNANIFYHEVRVPEYPLFEYPPYELALSSTLVDVIIKYDLDLLHVHYAIPHASAAYMAKQIVKEKTGRDVPFITTLHGTDITLVGKDKTYEPVVTFSINQSDAITAVSNNLREETYKYFNIKKDIQVIYNFVDIQRFDKKPIDAFKKAVAPKGEKIMVHASNFRKVKRVCDVVRIFAKVQSEVPCKLLMVGDGPERPVCEEAINKLGLENEVRFMGKQEQMEEILAISDLFVLPSEYESFGLAALEAMAAHVPVLSSNAGGLPEVNIEGKTGYLFNVGDVDTAAEKATLLLGNDDLLNQFKENAYQQALSFNINNIIPIYEKLYNKFCRCNCPEDE
ncbi:N-acetyl-alpha-D-glucosaminyl L-malate synthase BshA [Arachidicoccus ginsenosidivorans]|uniref:N-acetyl-alpha-D-glucosaminyl L-malate synthase BshA n=1 Tax=Arachidicoccus ginsenosidivorans TaxID=496057 RepID=A0A5B8VI99_9BACT|nr:N-acetyl-alpha-D-glucosaminyl L-malate synthase BshA [Arachidicoccus ginsenosidivorans]QEC70662.1 N-acetyl-alpha-D-glucosaminyl L-malate synthase BshA [Arachidicoccus ginsenosidivorans]